MQNSHFWSLKSAKIGQNEAKSSDFGTFKVVPYRDTGSVEPGSRPFYGSVSGSQSQFLGIDHA